MGGSFEVTGFIGYINDDEGLGAFAKKMRKATIDFVMSPLRPSVRMEQLGSHWTDFYEI